MTVTHIRRCTPLVQNGVTMHGRTCRLLTVGLMVLTIIVMILMG